jgi:signal transduction histidine kinase
MRRIRIALALVSLAALGLVALLAWRANEGLAAERAVRHQAVAERAFEEMERVLSEFLAREEARPFEHYAYTSPATGERSPLASRLEPFVVGAFQIDPEGAFSTPLEPADVAVARVRAVVGGVWQSGGGAPSERATLRLGKLLAEKKDEGALAQRSNQAPGTTRALAGPGLEDREPQALPGAAAPAPAREREPIGAFDALESLNRAAGDRAERKQKVASVSPQAVYGGMQAATAVETSARRSIEAFAAAAAKSAAPPGAPAQARSDAPALRIAFDPMVGVDAGDSLVIYRTVLVGQRGYRQGLVLDRAALGDWLDERVIRSSGLARVASLHFGGDAPAFGAGRYVFAHRFAEPFDPLFAQLALATLPGVAPTGALYALVGVLLAIGAAGLYAVHRTAAVVIQYAERRSNFAAAVTHELKTPLTAIRMYAEMLRDGLVPSEAKRQEYYATITGESERLSRLVDNVLEFSKLAGGRRELAIAVGMVGPVLEDAAEKLAPHAAREGFSLAVLVADDLPAVRFDRDALLQVLFNLVDNAMKYAKASERRTVELEARREGEAVTVAVRDFGPGVARAHLERVFEPFYRGESELTRTTKGTGIGLALVKELAERMGAAVSGANADGGGFRVRLAFPVA